MSFLVEVSIEFSILKEGEMSSIDLFTHLAFWDLLIVSWYKNLTKVIIGREEFSPNINYHGSIRFF